MLENIKSIFFIKIIFSNLDDKTKLELVKYNKNIQNKIDLNIMNYKRFSGKYIIYESKNKGKEYNGYNDYLIYEGEYLNRKRNGKGKEYYYKEQLKFEGEYLKGKKTGEGEKYNNNGILIFDGEDLNGKKMEKVKSMMILVI